MIKNIIFDLGNVVIPNPKMEVVKQFNKIFEILLDRYKLDAEECLLIDDDDTNKTLEVANSLGIKGRKVLPNNVQDIKKLLKENDVRI